MKMVKMSVVLFPFCFLCCAQATQITHGSKTVDMEFVKIGNPGNGAYTAEDGSFGAVDYEYGIAKYEVTAAQWSDVEAADPRINMLGKAPSWSGYQPAANMSWREAAMFCNWLTSGDAYTGVYQFDGAGTLTEIDRAAALATYGTAYALPTEDEWVKAAYYTGSKYSKFANGASKAPSTSEENRSKAAAVWDVGSGAVEQNGTYDMGGNLSEWTESTFDGVASTTSKRTTRDSAFAFGTISSVATRTGKSPTTYASDRYGFRVVELVRP
jgi:formylglycine-generating enzyme required for sulfatase activity